MTCTLSGDNVGVMQCTHAPIKIGTVAKDDALTPNKQGKILWHVDEDYLTSDLEKFKLLLAFERAFSIWQPSFAPIKIEPTADRREAPIIIHFMTNATPGLPSRFDNDTLAYAYFSQGRSLDLASNIFFNDDYAWAEMHSNNEINLFKVAVHEIGHAFGLDHSKLREDVMYPTYQPNDEVIITRDTVDGIDHLYGEFRDKLTPPAPKDPTVPVPVPPVDEDDVPEIEYALEVLRMLFPSQFWMTRLTNPQLVILGHIFELPTSSRQTKLENAKIILRFLKNTGRNEAG